MKYPYNLPDLDYSYDALEPYIDKETMEIHHAKHHNAYVAKANAVIEKYPDLQSKTLIELLQNPELIKDPADRQNFINQGGGAANHNLFFEILSPNPKTIPTGDLAKAIEEEFGPLDKLKEEISTAAKTQFASGWAWLAVDKDKKLKVLKTPNHNTPYTEGLTPILNIDVWEHAYYLKFQNKRADFIKSWWNVVNWEKIEEKYKQI